MCSLSNVHVPREQEKKAIVSIIDSGHVMSMPLSLKRLHFMYYVKGHCWKM